MRMFRASSVVLVAIVLGCTAVAPTTSPSPSPSTQAVAGQPIRIGIGIPPFAPSILLEMSNAMVFRAGRREIGPQLVYNALYRYDEALTAVPDLAAEPCDVADDQVTIRCTIVEASFHNGAPLTANDVAFTFELGRRVPECGFGLDVCLSQMLASATAVDERTVEFRLTAPNATFVTVALAGVFIESQAAVEAAYAPLGERAATLDAAEYAAAADAIAEQLASDQPDCAAPLANAEKLLQESGLGPLPRELFHRADGTLDECMYLDLTGTALHHIGESLGASGLDAIALAYRALPSNRAPIGTGPWRFVGIEDGNRMVLEAFEAYHRGRPATPRIEMRIYRGDPAAPRDGLVNGELDWVHIPAPFVGLYEELRDDPDLRFASFPDFNFYMLAYNLRPGMLFSDPNLRAAVELCIDKPATVDAATDGTGDVIYSPIEPASWAYQPDLTRPERDVAEARRLIELSGWVEGEDGIYRSEERRLATDVFVTAEDEPRVAFMDLVSEQVRDCGIHLNVVAADSDTVLAPIGEYPHIPGGRSEPFEAHFIGWIHGFDPHDDLWHSSSISSEEQPLGINFMGFSDPRVDELLEQGIATYDQRDRARIYRELQVILAEERPVLFGWASRQDEALDARLRLTDGELNPAARQWFWELEKLVLAEAPPAN
jgi:ABC-type transport system substrate-binding protein